MGHATKPRRRPAQPLERDWSAALAKRDREGCCRVCGAVPGPGVRLEAAHTIGRRFDQRLSPGGRTLVVHPDDTVPLCVKADGGCHQAFDAHRLDLLPYLTYSEQARAVGHVGIVAALRRLSGRDTASSVVNPSADR
jgi:hypothetical protein